MATIARQLSFGRGPKTARATTAHVHNLIFMKALLFHQSGVPGLSQYIARECLGFAVATSTISRCFLAFESLDLTQLRSQWKLLYEIEAPPHLSRDWLRRAVASRGKRYRLLSQVARLITGSQWSGPLFFGLKAPAKEAGNGTRY